MMLKPRIARVVSPEHLQCVVALGRFTEEDEIVTTGRLMREAASGFMYAFPRSGKRNNESDGFWPWLVTCKHVVREIGGGFRPEQMILRMNMENHHGTQMFAIPLRETTDDPSWFLHPTKDVAVIPIVWEDLDKRGVQWRVFAAGRDAISRREAAILGLSEGNSVFMLGFPTGWRPGRQDYPIVRHGVLAQVQGWLNEDHETFLVDGSGFPGNSGGPVITSPQFETASESGNVPRAAMIGMVSESKLYPIATGGQTLNESADLIEVIPVEAIDETIESAMQHGSGFIGWPL